MVVGAPFDGTGGSQTGSVSVYKEVSENKWELLDSKITPVDGSAGDQFGVSVDIDDESTIVIGSSVSMLLVVISEFHFGVLYSITFCNDFKLCSMQQLMKIMRQERHMCMIFRVCFLLDHLYNLSFTFSSVSITFDMCCWYVREKKFYSKINLRCTICLSKLWSVCLNI